MSPSSPLPQPYHIDLLYQKSADSWWVFRHGVDPRGEPLPYGRVVYYADSEQEAQQWIHAQQPLSIAC